MSGVGVAVGYLGTLTVLFLIGGIATDRHAQRAFLPAAALFALFALPLFLLVREHRAPGERRRAGPFEQLAATVRRARRRATRAAAAGALLLERHAPIVAVAGPSVKRAPCRA